MARYVRGQATTARTQEGKIITDAILKEIEDPEARAEVDSERAMMHALGAGCSLPVGAHASWNNGRLCLTAQITALDGTKTVLASEAATADRAVELGLATAETLRIRGGVEILESSYRSFCDHFKLMQNS